MEPGTADAWGLQGNLRSRRLHSIPKKVDGLDLGQWPFLSSPNVRVMSKPDDVDQGKPRPKPSRSEEALRIIEEYVNDLREIIKKLRQRIN